IAALLTPLLNGLEIGQHDGAGTTLVTAVAPTLSEEAVVQTAARIVPFLTDARLPEPVTPATLTAAGATVVLTPFASPAGGRGPARDGHRLAGLAGLARARLANGGPRGAERDRPREALGARGRFERGHRAAHDRGADRGA